MSLSINRLDFSSLQEGHVGLAQRLRTGSSHVIIVASRLVDDDELALLQT